MTIKYDPNALWVALSEFGEGNVFGIYPKIFAQLLLQEEAARLEGDTSEAERLVLPSDKEWRYSQYFHMVSRKKTLEEKQDINLRVHAEDAIEEWTPLKYVVLSSPRAPPPVVVRAVDGPAWDIAQVVKAGCLLCKPPRPVKFEDEQEMRKVYSLIYDVFRYKVILDQALEDIEFFINYPELAAYQHVTWLFAMELARRRWMARVRADVDRARRLLNDAGALFVTAERAIWEQRVHFAAAVARIRIKNRAFSLSDLLPPHLREERLSACVNKEHVTGWVNTFKAKKVSDLVKNLQELGYTYSGSRDLCAGEYRFDRVCPRFITIRPHVDGGIGGLDLIKNGLIVIQEREFCEGASILCRALRANSLCGAVVQTHASSPRCSAYLAAQLRELAAILKAGQPAAPVTPELGRLVVFGAGDKADSYVRALQALGVEATAGAAMTSSGCSVSVLSEPVHASGASVAAALDGVVAALATPPNSYSAVTDPIDLVCGRGGDLAMLEILTESEIDVNGKARVQSILEEQKKTLKALLSKPQIQLVLYETHSSLEAENQAQVTRAVAEANRLARERHLWLRKKHRDVHSVIKNESIAAPADVAPRVEVTDKEPPPGDYTPVDLSQPKRPASATPPSTAIRTDTQDALNSTECTETSRPPTTKARPIPEIKVPGDEQIPKNPDSDWANVYVPGCDLFEVRNLPTLGNGLNINYILERDGCYLGLIQRQDPPYHQGYCQWYRGSAPKSTTKVERSIISQLIGCLQQTIGRVRVAEQRGLFGSGASTVNTFRHKRKEPAATTPRQRRRKNNTFEVERIAAPTHASQLRSTRRGSAPASLGLHDDPEQLNICPRHARRIAAAEAYCNAACTCDGRHRHVRRQSTDMPGCSMTPTPPPPPCRRPFPLTIHHLRLKAFTPHRFITYSYVPDKSHSPT